jgi:hypothetical protein
LCTRAHKRRLQHGLQYVRKPRYRVPLRVCERASPPKAAEQSREGTQERRGEAADQQEQPPRPAPGRSHPRRRASGLPGLASHRGRRRRAHHSDLKARLARRRRNAPVALPPDLGSVSLVVKVLLGSAHGKADAATPSEAVVRAIANAPVSGFLVGVRPSQQRRNAGLQWNLAKTPFLGDRG